MYVVKFSDLLEVERERGSIRCAQHACGIFFWCCAVGSNRCASYYFGEKIID